MFTLCTGVKVRLDGETVPIPLAPYNNRCTDQEYAAEAELIYTYETATVPRAQVRLQYCVKGDGGMTVTMQYTGVDGLPELPAPGLRWMIPFSAEGFCYEGLSGETYPDRMAGGEEGIYEVKGLPVTLYLVPQECGMHMKTRWVEIRSSGEKTAGTLRVESIGQTFAFSCLPNTASELENAFHQEELPRTERTVLCLYAAVRGVAV